MANGMDLGEIGGIADFEVGVRFAAQLLPKTPEIANALREIARGGADVAVVKEGLKNGS